MKIIKSEIDHKVESTQDIATAKDNIEFSSPGFEINSHESKQLYNNNFSVQIKIPRSHLAGQSIGLMMSNAASCGLYSKIKHYLDNGVSAKEDCEITTPLIQASRHGHLKIVELLISKGANIDQKDHMNQTALRAAVSSRHENIVRLLLQAGADILDVDEFKISILQESKRQSNNCQQSNSIYQMIKQSPQYRHHFSKRPRDFMVD